MPLETSFYSSIRVMERRKHKLENLKMAGYIDIFESRSTLAFCCVDKMSASAKVRIIVSAMKAL